MLRNARAAATHPYPLLCADVCELSAELQARAHTVPHTYTWCRGLGRETGHQGWGTKGPGCQCSQVACGSQACSLAARGQQAQTDFP